MYSSGNGHLPNLKAMGANILLIKHYSLHVKDLTFISRMGPNMA